MPLAGAYLFGGQWFYRYKELVNKMKNNGHHHHHGGKGNCKQTLTHMSEYVDDDLKGTEKKSLEDHLHNCKACMAVLSTLRKTIEIFKASTPKMPKGMAKEVRQGIKREIAAEEKNAK